MPLIDTRVTVKMTAPQKEEIKTELGRLITTLNKPETYLHSRQRRLRHIPSRQRLGLERIEFLSV